MAITPRTTESMVKDLLIPAGDYDTVNCPSLKRFVYAANVVVTRVKTCAIAKGLDLSTDELREIETWLAAHFFKMSDRQYSSRSTLDASGQFGGQVGMGIEATTYGQTALTIDYSGCLTAINKRQFASATWLGKAPSEQISYEDRD